MQASPLTDQGKAEFSNPQSISESLNPTDAMQFTEGVSHQERASFWKRNNKQIASILHEGTREDSDKAQEIANLRIVYLRHQIDHPVYLPEVEKEYTERHPLTKGVAFYHHRALWSIVSDVAREGLLTHNDVALDESANASTCKAREKIRRITKKDALPSEWLWQKQSDISLLPDMTQAWERGANFIIDPNYLYTQFPTFYKRVDWYHRGTSDVPYEATFPGRIPYRALLGLYFTNGQQENMRFAIRTGLERKGEIENLKTIYQENIQQLVQHFQQKPRNALPIFADADFGTRRTYLQREEVVEQPALIWPNPH